jgi:hypothetical protein
MEHLAAAIMAGKVMDSLFNESLRRWGLKEKWEQPEEGQPFYLGPLQEGLARAGYPDAGG